MSTNVHGEAGTSSAGLKTMVLPNASAGAIFQAGIASGKFHGVISPTTPSGSRVTSTSMPGRTDAIFSPPQRLASEELEDGARPGGLADAVRERFALLARQQAAQLVLPRQNLAAGSVEDVEALLRCRLRPPANAGAPRRWPRPDLRASLARTGRRHRSGSRVDVGIEVGRVDGATVDQLGNIAGICPSSKVRVPGD